MTIEEFAFHFLSVTVLLWLSGVTAHVLERLRPVKELPSLKKEFWQDMGYAYVNGLLALPISEWLFLALSTYLLALFFPGQLFAGAVLALPWPVQLLLALLAMDVAVYIRHRFMHEMLWPVHAIHHSPEDIDWLTHFRAHPIETIIAGMVNALILYAIGFPQEMILYAGLIIGVMDTFNHANLRLSFPRPLCYLIASPDYHKWHHARETGAINKNYVVVFPFLDLLFGTYYFPRPHPPAHTGILLKPGGMAPVPAGFLKQLTFPGTQLRYCRPASRRLLQAAVASDPGNRY